MFISPITKYSSGVYNKNISNDSSKFNYNNITFESNKVMRKKVVYGIAALLGIDITVNDIFVKRPNNNLNINNNYQNINTKIKEQVDSISETVNKIADNCSGITKKINESERLNKEIENLIINKSNTLKELANLNLSIKQKQKQIWDLDMQEYDLELKIKDLKLEKDDIENIDDKLKQLKDEREKIDIEFNLLQHRKNEVNRYIREKEKRCQNIHKFKQGIDPEKEKMMDLQIRLIDEVKSLRRSQYNRWT